MVKKHIRAWCNGSIRVSKTFDLGSNPSARAKKLENQAFDNLMSTVNDSSNLQTFKSKFEMSKLTAYVKDSYRELLEKVTWPTWSQLQQSTMIVLVATLIITGIVWVMDLGIASLLELVYSLFK